MKSDTQMKQPEAAESHSGVLEALKHPIQVVIRNGGERAYNGLLSALNDKKDEASQGLVKASDTVVELSDWLNENGPEQVAGYVQSGRQALEKFSGYVQDSEVEELLEDVKDYARQNPMIMAGTIFALGFLAGRVARSAAPADQPEPRSHAKGGGKNGKK